MIILLTITVILFLVIIISTSFNKNYPKKLENPQYNFCILIPARFESKVIEELLKSISAQTYKIPMKNVYVIVETKEDPTVEICKKYQATVFYRKNLSLQRKGYALDECLKEIYTKNYDAYFIFDADNVLDKDYFKNMIPVYEKGYDIGIGYRNIKNGNNKVAVSSALIFSIINTVLNDIKCKKTCNLTLSGTGFYIKGNWITKWKGFPFFELTEDYELYLYSVTKNMTSYYNKKSIFYDEQPTTFKESFKQRKRWIRGYFNVRKKYFCKLFKSIKANDKNIGSKISEILGLLPVIFLILTIVYPLLKEIFYIFIGKGNIYTIIINLVFIYLLLILLTLYLLIKESKLLRVDNQVKWKVLFYHPILLISYIPCFIAAITKKEIKWEKIEHKETLSKK